MTEGSLITQELQALLGQEQEPEHFEIENGHIRRFTEAIGDPNPLFSDLDYARKSRYGNIVAPPTFIIDISMKRMANKLIAKKPPSTGFLNGGIEIEYYKPIKVGDTITTTTRLVDLQEKSSRRGKLLLMLVDLTYRNQREELVMKVRNTFIGPQNQ